MSEGCPVFYFLLNGSILTRATFILLQIVPDGEEHTARTATNEGAQSEGDQSSSTDTEDDFLNAVLSPLMGIIQDAEQEQSSESQPAAAKPAAPQEAPLAAVDDPETDSKDLSEDADAVQADDSCEYSNDGECDEPEYCMMGTDTTDCNSELVKEFDKGQDREEVVQRSGEGSGEGSGAQDWMTAYNTDGNRVV